MIRFPTGRPILLAVVLSVVSSMAAASLSPDQELWNSFLNRPVQAPVVPEDEELGLLADLRNPDADWGSSIGTCESVFTVLAGGGIPEAYFSPDLAVPLGLAFEAVMEGEGVFRASRRYGRPERTGDRLAVPIRLAGEDTLEYGHIYLVRRDGAWLVEQWAVHIAPFVERAE